MRARHRMLLTALIAVFVLAGCAQRMENDSPDGEGNLLSKPEQRLVVLFQAMLQMDRKPELAFTSEQARGLLPYVKKSQASGKLSQEDSAAMVALFTSAQKIFYTNIVDKYNQHLETIKRNNEHLETLSDEEREKLLQNLQQRRSGQAKNGALPGPENNKSADSDKSVEQQLVELLQNRVNP